MNVQEAHMLFSKMWMSKKQNILKVMCHQRTTNQNTSEAHTMVDTQNTHKNGVVAHTFNPSIWVIETD